MNMFNRATRLRLRRIFRRRRNQLEAVTQQAEKQFDTQFVNRLEKLLHVQRFVAGWIFLIVVLTTLTVMQTVGLNQFYLKSGPVPGGIYNEGMVGTYSNANPIYATGPVDTSISRLIFAGLFKYDEANMLVGNLATGYKVDESGKIYTVQLKPNLHWHDGVPLTAKDVVFTYQLIQNPDARSPLLSSWQGITIAQQDARTITFRLPSALTAFPDSLTTGILPEHVLKNLAPAKIRASNFNTTAPIGAGPFKWDALQLGSSVDPGDATALISLKAFDAYNAGRPKLDGFILHTYESPEKLLTAYKRRLVEGAAGLQNLPEPIRKDASSHVYNFSTTAATMVFFKTSTGVLSDTAVRRALVLAADRQAIVRALEYQTKIVNAPVLKSQFAYDKTYAQPSFDLAAAATTLDQAGWVKGKGGVRSKDNKQLRFQLLAEDTPDNKKVLEQLKKTWKSLGVIVEPVLQATSDFQGAVETHSYDAVLYGIAIGPDPDVFVYWDSSQADVRSSNRLNFSEYKSAVADAALEAGRTRQDVAVRTLKYKPFLKAWQEDAPALALYQPNALYVTRGYVAGLKEHTINTDADRYYSIQNWAVKTGRVPR
ncbi:MAG: peptide ABC transporter substrate-binding protein [Candidatus Saccharimonadales bacterium]